MCLVSTCQSIHSDGHKCIYLIIYLPKETVSDVESCLRTVIISLSMLSPDNMVPGGAGDGDDEEEEDEGEGNDAILF